MFMDEHKLNQKHKDKNDTVLNQYGIKLNSNDLETLKMNIEKIREILDFNQHKSLYDKEILSKMLYRFIKRLQRINPNTVIYSENDGQMDSQMDSQIKETVKPTNIVVFEETGKGRGYFVLVFKPNPTEIKPIPDVLVLCHSTESNKYIFTPILETNIGLINKDTLYFMEKIKLGQWKLAKLGNDPNIFSFDTHELINKGIEATSFLTFTDDKQSLKKPNINLDEYNNVRKYIENQSWKINNITKEISKKLFKWIGTSSPTDGLCCISKELFLNRSNGRLNITFGNNKDGESYDTVIPDLGKEYEYEYECEITHECNRSIEDIDNDFQINNHKNRKNKTKEVISINTLCQMTNLPSKIKVSLTIFHKIESNKIKSMANSKRCPHMNKPYGCIMKKGCIHEHPLGWECKSKFYNGDNGTKRMEAIQAEKLNLPFNKGDLIW